MLTMLVAYDDDGNVIATLDYLVTVTLEGRPALVDFETHEKAGGEMTDVWTVPGARGSKVWPEWLGIRAHDFRVEKEGPPGNKHVAALVHRASGRRRERRAIEDTIRLRAAAAGGELVDVTDLVGAPDRPIILDESGRPVARHFRRRLPTL